VYGFTKKLDRETFRRSYEVDTNRKYSIGFFVRGEPYRIWGMLPWDVHLIGITEDGSIFLFGTDIMGRDLFSRVFYGGRISLSIGLVGVCLTLIIGSVAGAASGYLGGRVDNTIMRGTEIVMSFPQLPLWMALAAALPPGFSPLTAFFYICLILGALSSAGLTREIRGKVLSVKEEDFVLAARISGASTAHIITKHLIPNCMSHIIVVATLLVPGMILAETALSFLGLGLRPPMTSWGVLLREAQVVRVLAHTPWLITPAFFTTIAILAYNFMGDGLRDAVDPYKR
jgi:peptide/nickel transport system permease protein